MAWLQIGKILETIGAGLILWVAAHAFYIEVMIEGPVRLDEAETDREPSDLDRIRQSLEKINEKRRRQFGFWEALFVLAGSAAIFVGCALYLIGLFQERS